MAKRFIDTDLLRDPFVKKLPSNIKFFWMYLIMHCDNAGMWCVEIDVAASRLGCDLDEDEVKEALQEKIVELDDSVRWFIPSFITFQYKNELSLKNKAHASVIEKLLKYDLLAVTDENEGLYTLKEKKIKPLKNFCPAPVKGLQDKDKDKEKDKDQEKEKEKDKGASQISIEVWPTFEHFWDQYDKKVGDKEKLKKKWASLPQPDKEIIMDYIPDYRRAQPEKKYRKNPETFLNNKSWNDEIITETNEQQSGRAEQWLQDCLADVEREVGV